MDKTQEEVVVEKNVSARDIPGRANKITRLSAKSTSKMTHNVRELNKKVLQFINNQ
jgi:hypothetical protein